MRVMRSLPVWAETDPREGQGRGRLQVLLLNDRDGWGELGLRDLPERWLGSADNGPSCGSGQTDVIRSSRFTSAGDQCFRQGFEVVCCDSVDLPSSTRRSFAAN
jgi:hypothetical protein